MSFHMKNYYTYQQTFHIDTRSFLSPFEKRLSKGSRILDVGCGSGRDLLWLKERGYHTLAFVGGVSASGLVGQFFIQ